MDTARTRLRKRALSEMRHRAVAAGFRGGNYKGESTRELRSEALLARLPDGRFIARDVAPVSHPLFGDERAAVAFTVVGVVAAATYFWRRGLPTSAAYLQGSDILTEVW